MIRTSLRVEEHNIKCFGENRAFAEALTEWEDLEWIKFLREHGTIKNVEVFKDMSADGIYQVYGVTWELPAQKETWFRLKYFDQDLR